MFQERAPGRRVKPEWIEHIKVTQTVPRCWTNILKCLQYDDTLVNDDKSSMTQEFWHIRGAVSSPVPEISLAICFRRDWTRPQHWVRARVTHEAHHDPRCLLLRDKWRGPGMGTMDTLNTEDNSSPSRPLCRLMSQPKPGRGPMSSRPRPTRPWVTSTR